MKLFEKQKQSHRYRKQTYGYQRIRGEGIDWEIKIDIYILPSIKQITNKNLLNSTANSTQYSAMAYMGKNLTMSGYICIRMVSLLVKNLPANPGDKEMQVQSLSQEDSLEERTICSSILTWRIPWTEQPGGLQSIGSHRVRHNRSNLAHITD